MNEQNRCPPLNGLLNGTIASIEGLLIIKFPMQIMIDMLNGNDNFNVIKEVVRKYWRAI